MTTPESNTQGQPTAPSATVRPKILKRPAQFSAQGAVLTRVDSIANTPRILANADPVTAHAITKSWQDDGRFAMALLALIIGLNVALSYWLATVQPPAAASTPLHNASLPLVVDSTSATTVEDNAEESDTVHQLDDTAPTEPTESY